MLERKSVVAVLAAVGLGFAALACGTTQREPTPTPSPPGPTPTPRPLYASDLDRFVARSICVEVQQAYPDVEDKSPEPIAEGLGDILAGIGVRVLAAESDCDGHLTIVLEGKPHTCDYQNWGECHSGARVSGQMVLDVPGFPRQELELQGWFLCPFEIRSCAQPTEAPFDKAWTQALLRGLSQLWGPEVLLQALRTGSGWEREVAAGELGMFGKDDGVVEALAGALGDHDYEVRLEAANSLVTIGPDAVGAQSALIQALEDGNLFVRAAAAESLGLFREEATEAVPALILALADTAPGVRKAAAKSLGQITGEHFGEDVAAWEAWSESQN